MASLPTSAQNSGGGDCVHRLFVDAEGRNMAGDREVVIAVMGITGAGKSSLVKQITGENVEVGDGLEACTQRITPVRIEYRGVMLTLLDSPGFNDTYRTDTDVLRDISDFLSLTYSHGFRLSGILYLHPISHARMEGSSLRSLRMFRKLVGNDALANVLLVSTHWSRVSAEEGERREGDLRGTFWKPLLDNGATMTRHRGDAASARALLDRLVNKARVVLDIQRELVDEGKELIDTAAGSALNEELIALQRRHEAELRQVRDEMQDAIRECDTRTQVELNEVRRQLEDQVAAARRSQNNLRDRERIAAREKQRLETQLQALYMSMEGLREGSESKILECEQKLQSEFGFGQQPQASARSDRGEAAIITVRNGRMAAGQNAVYGHAAEQPRETSSRRDTWLPAVARVLGMAIQTFFLIISVVPLV